eukprot:950264_1
MEEFERNNIVNLPDDLVFIDNRQWKLMKGSIFKEKEKDIKDVIVLKRMKKKFEKIEKIMKKQKKHKKQPNSVDNKPNLKPRKSIKKNKKTKTTNSKKKKAKCLSKKSNSLQFQIERVCINWHRKWEVRLVFDSNLFAVIMAFYDSKGGTKQTINKWLKREGIFDMYIKEELMKLGIITLPNDLCLITTKQWENICFNVRMKKEKEIKDFKVNQRMKKKLEKKNKKKKMHTKK